MGCKNAKHALSQDDLELLLEQTSYGEKEIKENYKSFKNNYPDGYMSVEKLMEQQKALANYTPFLDHIWRIYDVDKNGCIDFKELMLTRNVARAGTMGEKISLIFRVFDTESKGAIDLGEMTKMMHIIYENIRKQSTMAVWKTVEELSADERAKNIFCNMGLECDGKMIDEHFVNTSLQNKEFLKLLQESDQGDSLEREGVDRVSYTIAVYTLSFTVIFGGRNLGDHDDLVFLKSHTHFEDSQVEELFKGFKELWPNGIMNFDCGNENVCRVLDLDKNGYIDFKEYLLALHASITGTLEEKINMTFSMFDIKGNGVIHLAELRKIMHDIYTEKELAGNVSIINYEEKADIMFHYMDLDGDNTITEEKFMPCILYNKVLMEKLEHISNILHHFYDSFGQVRKSSLTAEEWAKDFFCRTDFNYRGKKLPDQFLNIYLPKVEVMKNLGPDAPDSHAVLIGGFMRVVSTLIEFTCVIALHDFSTSKNFQTLPSGACTLS